MNDEERERRQFTVTQSWIIRVKPDQASGALNTAISAGANESGWIQWIVEDPSTLQAKAAAEAVANARKIAEQIAAKSGVHLGHLVSASENRSLDRIQRRHCRRSGWQHLWNGRRRA